MDDSTHYDAPDDAAGPEPAGLRRARTLSHLLDDAWRIPGTDARVGLDPLISVVPVGGDAVAAAVSLYVVLEAWRLGASWVTIARMLANVAIDATGGSVPVLGTLFDAEFKANQRNVELLEAEAGGADETGTVVEFDE